MARLAVGLAIAACAGCAAPPIDPPPPVPEAACVGVPPARLAGDVRPIFQARCAGAECHGANFGGPRAWTDLVHVRAAECDDGRALVAPYSPTESYLYQKLTGADLCSGLPMPRRADPLTTAELAAVTGWICAGAADD